MPSTPLIQPVILSGGSGTRLWPLSTPERPKQLLALTGGETMLQLTARRMHDATRYQPPIVVCGATHAGQVQEQLVEAGTAPGRMIVEPAPRNTAPAIALAAMSVAPDTPLLVMPSDHVIVDTDAFRDAVDRALPVALDGWIVTFGIEPDRPETGYGYIRRGDALSERVHKVARFVEKPDADKARAYLAEGGFCWNAGIFLFRAGDYIDALAAHAPVILDNVQRSVECARSDGLKMHPDEEAFAAAPSISIDYAVLEKIDNVAVAPVSMGWSDIGSWDAVYEFREKDESGNAISPEVIALDTAGSLILSDGPSVAAVGVKDLLILVSGNSVLVLPRGESQRVKEVGEVLAKHAPKS